ncbi:hypothetical protein BC834DRAFT_55906 [Gloeopeniophorella convolvens]|nr:hypothetical protein BC834DRAFT_55906 [Gloeopeniophorella convolvens]
MDGLRHLPPGATSSFQSTFAACTSVRNYASVSGTLCQISKRKTKLHDAFGSCFPFAGVPLCSALSALHWHSKCLAYPDFIVFNVQFCGKYNIGAQNPKAPRFGYVSGSKDIIQQLTDPISHCIAAQYPPVFNIAFMGPPQVPPEVIYHGVLPIMAAKFTGYLASVPRPLRPAE